MPPVCFVTANGVESSRPVAGHYQDDARAHPCRSSAGAEQLLADTKTDRAWVPSAPPPGLENLKCGFPFRISVIVRKFSSAASTSGTPDAAGQSDGYCTTLSTSRVLQRDWSTLRPMLNGGSVHGYP